MTPHRQVIERARPLLGSVWLCGGPSDAEIARARRSPIRQTAMFV